MSYKIFSLKNDLRIIYKHNNSRVSYCSLTIDTGSSDEGSEKEYGIAHFIEHCLFKGTNTRSYKEIINALDNVGSELNAYTSKEETCIYSVFLSEYSLKAVEIICDIACNSIFPDEEIRKEKKIILEEIDSYKDNPSELIFDEFEEKLLQGSPLSHPILGTRESVTKLNKNVILNFYKKNYVPKNMVLSYIGKENINNIIKIVEKITENCLNTPNNTPQKAKSNYTINNNHKFNITKEKNIHQCYSIIGCKAFSNYDEKRTIMHLLSNIIGGPAMNSILNIKLREENAICYSIETNFTPYKNTGVFSIFLGTDKKNLNKTFDIIQNELKKLRNKKLSSNKLEMYKTQLKGQIIISLNNNVNEILSIGKSLLLYDKIDSINEIVKKIDKITSSDICEVANIILSEDKLSIIKYLSSN